MEIKKELFKHCYEAWLEHAKYSKTLKTDFLHWSYNTDTFLWNRYIALYNLIMSCGLEDDYYKWKGEVHHDDL